MKCGIETPSKWEVIGRCGGDEKTEWQRRTDKSRTLKNNIYITPLQTWFSYTPDTIGDRKVNSRGKYVAEHIYYLIFNFFNFFFFSVRLLSVVRGHWFFHPRHNGQWPPTSKDFYTRSYTLHYFLILFFRKSQYLPCSMLSAKQGHYWYHFYNAFGMTRSLTGDWTWDLPLSKPALYH